MISRLKGVVSEISGAVAVIDVHGVGYEVWIPESVAHQLPPIGEEATLLTRQIFREDGVSLYGFVTSFQRRLFDLLLEVKGCGPKVGLALIGQVGEDEVAAAISRQDPKALIRANGVGVRLAERMIVELKDKIPQEQLVQKIAARTPKPATTPEDELVEALLALGYRRNEAEIAADQARQEATDLQAQVLAALRRLKK